MKNCVSFYVVFANFSFSFLQAKLSKRFDKFCLFFRGKLQDLCEKIEKNMIFPQRFLKNKKTTESLGYTQVVGK